MISDVQYTGVPEVSSLFMALVAGLILLNRMTSRSEQRVS